jgi:hypothetical protein
VMFTQKARESDVMPPRWRAAGVSVARPFTVDARCPRPWDQSGWDRY